MTASDWPAVWAIVARIPGYISGLWESEDYESTAPPIFLPEYDDANPVTGYTVVNAGLPTLTVIGSLYTNVLTDAQETVAMSCSSDYFVKRGWLSEPWTNIAVPPSVPTRYEPSKSSMGHAVRGKGDRVKCD